MQHKNIPIGSFLQLIGQFWFKISRLYTTRTAPLVVSFALLLTCLIACKNKPAKIDADDSKNSGNSPKADEIQLTQQQIQLGDIGVDTISKQDIGDNIVFTGTLNFNSNRTASISARVAGRIDKLYFKNIGDYVRKGDKLFDIYSEDLNNASQEYIFSVERKQTLDNSLIDFDRLIQSAKNKLLLWGLTETQITNLTNNKQAPRLVSIYSTGAGYITDLTIKEGDYVMEGGKIVNLADLSTLWAEAQVYTSQIEQIDKNSAAMVKVPDMPGKEFTGHIDFVNPEINPDTRIDLVRVVIPNTGYLLKPGMPAYIIFKAPAHKALTLPLDAVLRDGTVAVVWVQTGKDTFESKIVETGLETENNIEIKSGLNKGDIVVITGAYLLNSEYKFKRGSSPMGGMKM